jgi:hypothetical protein
MNYNLNTFMMISDISAYDIFVWAAVIMVVLAFAATMSKFKDNLQHQIEEYCKEISNKAEKHKSNLPQDK